MTGDDRPDDPSATADAPRPGERWFLAALAVFSAAALWESYGISGFSSASGAGVFPMLASGIMLAASLWLLARRWGTTRAGDLLGAAAMLFPWRTAVFVALMVGFVLAIPRVGFLAAAGLFIFAALAVNWRPAGLWRSLGAAALVTAVALFAVWLVFREAFQVVLPTGTLWRTLLAS